MKVGQRAENSRTVLDDLVNDTHISKNRILPHLEILLVEESRVNQRLAESVFKKQHHQWRIAKTKRDVLNSISLKVFDLILIQVSLLDADACITYTKVRGKQKGFCTMVYCWHDERLYI
ncbi:MAG: hypothetical protein ACFB2W_06645 [Leptolyngbyaceae cyanobacterium]